jgi:GNAT superfamily N-acetyltransferase
VAAVCDVAGELSGSEMAHTVSSMGTGLNQFVVRPALAEDAAAIGELIREFGAYLRALGDEAELKFDERVYLRDGFGAHPAFSGLVAEHDGEIVGYLLYHPGYDADYATRTLHVVDLYVRESWRGRGVGRLLMNEAVQICLSLGGGQLFWAVYAPNKAAIRFYERLGARFTQNMLFMRLDCRFKPAGVAAHSGGTE